MTHYMRAYTYACTLVSACLVMALVTLPLSFFDSRETISYPLRGFLLIASGQSTVLHAS